MTSLKESRRLFGRSLLILVFYLGWALKNVAIEITLSDIDSLELTLAISLVVVVSTIPIILVQNRRRRRRTHSWLHSSEISLKLALLSVTTAVAMYTTVVAIDLIGSFYYAVTEVIAYAISLSMLSLLFLGDRVTGPVVKATIISIAGFLIFNLGTGHVSGSLQLAGFGAAVVASFFWASSIIIIKQMLTAGITPEQLVFFRFLLLAILALLFIPDYLASLPLEVLLQILLIGLFGYALLFMILFYGLQDVSPTIVAVFIASGPLFTAIFTWLLIPGTTYTAIEMAGLAIIICGLLYAMLRQGDTQP